MPKLFQLLQAALGIRCEASSLGVTPQISHALLLQRLAYGIEQLLFQVFHAIIKIGRRLLVHEQRIVLERT